MSRVAKITPISSYCKIRVEGGSHVLTVSRFVPADWLMVNVQALPQITDDVVTLVIHKVA